MTASNGLLNTVFQSNVTIPQLPIITPNQLKDSLQGLFDELSEKIVQSVNEARFGHLIDDSEEPVRKAGHEFLRAAFETALQQKIDAAEASFSPSGDDEDRSCHQTPGDQANAQQRAPATAGVDGCGQDQSGPPMV